MVADIVQILIDLKRNQFLFSQHKKTLLGLRIYIGTLKYTQNRSQIIIRSKLLSDLLLVAVTCCSV